MGTRKTRQRGRQRRKVRRDLKNDTDDVAHHYTVLLLQCFQNTPTKYPKLISLLFTCVCKNVLQHYVLYMCAREHLHNAAPCTPCHFALIRNKQKFRVVSLTPWQSLLSATVIRNRAAAAIEGSQFPMLLLFSRLLYFLLLFVCLLSSSNINHTSQHLQYNLQSCNKPRMSRDVSFQQLTKKWRHRATVKRLLIHQPNDLTPASATEWRQ